jgi:hypothetical protein
LSAGVQRRHEMTWATRGDTESDRGGGRAMSRDVRVMTRGTQAVDDESRLDHGSKCQVRGLRQGEMVWQIGRVTCGATGRDDGTTGRLAHWHDCAECIRLVRIAATHPLILWERSQLRHRLRWYPWRSLRGRRAVPLRPVSRGCTISGNRGSAVSWSRAGSGWGRRGGGPVSARSWWERRVGGRWRCGSGCVLCRVGRVC